MIMPVEDVSMINHMTGLVTFVWDAFNAAIALSWVATILMVALLYCWQNSIFSGSLTNEKRRIADMVIENTIMFAVFGSLSLFSIYALALVLGVSW